MQPIARSGRHSAIRSIRACSVRLYTRSHHHITAATKTSSIRIASRPENQRATFASTAPVSPLASPLNIPKWLADNSHLLQPPVNNYCVYNDNVTVMIVGGPNARTDYHINTTAEWFYQYKGAMLLKVIDPATNAFRDITIGEGDMFLLPPNTPHNPVRFANTVGIVIEQHRPDDSIDRLRWYCQNCKAQVHEASFHCTDLGTQIKSAVQAFEADTQARTCRECGEVCDVRPKEAPTLAM